MKRVFTGILLSFVCLTHIYAEKIEDKYIIRPIKGGLLYFILPYELPSLQKEPAAELDVTYITGQDSIRLNMTFVCDTALSVEHITFNAQNSITISDFETFFIDRSGKKYIHRYSCRIPYESFKNIYAGHKPFRLQIHAKERVLEYGFTGKWEKEQTWMLQILQLTERNRQHLHKAIQQ